MAYASAEKLVLVFLGEIGGYLTIADQISTASPFLICCVPFLSSFFVVWAKKTRLVQSTAGYQIHKNVEEGIVTRQLLPSWLLSSALLAQS